MEKAANHPEDTSENKVAIDGFTVIDAEDHANHMEDTSDNKVAVDEFTVIGAEETANHMEDTSEIIVAADDLALIDEEGNTNQVNPRLGQETLSDDEDAHFDDEMEGVVLTPRIEIRFIVSPESESVPGDKHSEVDQQKDNVEDHEDSKLTDHVTEAETFETPKNREEPTENENDKATVGAQDREEINVDESVAMLANCSYDINVLTSSPDDIHR
jgi:hypothetical protein